jgi:heme-degrading monooxygenase HmoA
MILEVAILDVIPEQETEFEAAFADASRIISSMPGYLSLEISKATR